MTARVRDEVGYDLAGLGWSDFFREQIELAEKDLIPARIANVHRDRVTAISQTGMFDLVLPAHFSTATVTVGDWILAEPETRLLRRCLDRRTLLQRSTETGRVPQLAGANIDTLFIVTSCNADFNIARLERYLALANQAEIPPVILLTKADTVTDADGFKRQAEVLQRGLAVVALNARMTESMSALSEWCAWGKTVALIGSSGVGKSTLVNTLAGPGREHAQQTGGIREHDAKGRHTTTSRSLHAIEGDGWVIDTPGMRTLHLGDVASGIDRLFAEITDLEPLCKFRNCTHDHEPGCAVRAALAAGEIDPGRLARWRKLVEENSKGASIQVGSADAGRSAKRRGQR